MGLHTTCMKNYLLSFQSYKKKQKGNKDRKTTKTFFSTWRHISGSSYNFLEYKIEFIELKHRLGAQDA